MSNFYMVGEAYKVADSEGVTTVRAIEVGGIIYAYWRYSTFAWPTFDNTAKIMVSTSSDGGTTWTTPVTAYSTTLDSVVTGVVHNGTTFYMLIANIDASTEAVTTKILSSTGGTISWSVDKTVTWTENWAFPTDLYYDGTKYYLAATVRIGSTGPTISTVKYSTDLDTWTSTGYVSQLTATDNSWARIYVDTSGTIHLVHREGLFYERGLDDRILYCSWVASWGVIDDLIDGTGQPAIQPLDTGLAVIYLDQSIQSGKGIWCWGYYENGIFARRGTFIQGFLYGRGADMVLTDTGFSAVYGVRTDVDDTASSIYYRAFVAPGDTDPKFLPKRVFEKESASLRLENFSVEVSVGDYWISLSDGLRFFMSAEDYGDKAQTLRRITADSPFFDGTYLVHSVRENVEERVSVYVVGSSQNQVTENIALLEEIIAQPSYRIRMIIGDHAETWLCQPADYTISRGHVLMHNQMAMVRMSIPRHPSVTYEVT